MIDLVTDFARNEQAISRFIGDRVDSYFNSKCRRLLGNRYRRLMDSINMSFPEIYGRPGRQGSNEFRSKTAFPLLRERYKLRRALTKEYFRGDPMISLKAIGNTPLENAINMQDLLNLNLEHTRFRQTCFDRAVHYASAVGSAVIYSHYQAGERMGYKTVQTPSGYARVYTSLSTSKNVLNHAIHPLDYFQDESIASPGESQFAGFIDSWPLSDLISAYKNETDKYIRENLRDVLELAKEGVRNEHKFDIQGTGADSRRVGVDIERWWGRVNIPGNEDDTTVYYAERVGNKIIRFQSFALDDEITPLSVMCYWRRPEYWWGNTDGEEVLPHEQFTNLIMNMKADAALQLLNRYVFYDRDIGLDPDLLNEARINGGLVGVDLKGGRLRDLFFEFQPQDNSTQAVEWLMREIKESTQKMSSKPDFARASNTGGLVNTTATAANIIAGEGDVLERDAMEVFSYGVADMGRINVVILQQELGDRVAIRPDAKQAQRVIAKNEFLGNYGYRVDTSLTKTRENELMRLQNVLTMFQNFKGTGDPTWQNLNLAEVARDLVRRADVGDVDKILPAQESIAAGVPFQPSTIMPGQELAGVAQNLSAAPLESDMVAA